MNMTLQIQCTANRKELKFPVMLYKMSEQETKHYHLKKLFELSKKSLGRLPILDKPNREQKQWIKRKLRDVFQ
jgi:hypothetical protein